MKHVRQAIREAAVAVLEGLSITGNNVFENRLYPLQESQLPALIVSTEGDKAAYLDMSANPSQQRDIRLTVTATARAANNVDDELDSICAEVETVIADAQFPIKLNKKYLGTETKDDVVGSQPVMTAKMHYEISVITKQNNPQTAV